MSVGILQQDRGGLIAAATCIKNWLSVPDFQQIKQKLELKGEMLAYHPATYICPPKQLQ